MMIEANGGRGVAQGLGEFGKGGGLVGPTMSSPLRREGREVSLIHHREHRAVIACRSAHAVQTKNIDREDAKIAQFTGSPTSRFNFTFLASWRFIF